jgi:hypothetical protein
LCLFVSNRNTELVTEGASFYSKYGFIQQDLNSHFRLAAFGRYSFNNADIHQNKLKLWGTILVLKPELLPKLIKKVAVSSSISFEKRWTI